MRIRLVIFMSLILAPFAAGGGSLSWVEVTQRLSKECPKLLVVINKCFDVRPVGGALRLGSRSIDVIEGRAGLGDRVPPYEFDCKLKGSADSYPLTIEVNNWDDGWKFIIREKQMKKPVDQAEAVEPTTAPKSKSEAIEKRQRESAERPQ